MRADARRSVEKIRDAAVELFTETGFDAPIEEIARRAGVSKGTVYHRFGSREGLIDTVVEDLVLRRLGAISRRVRELPDPWSRLETYLREIWALQRASPAANDVLCRAYPDAEVLARICDEAVTTGSTLVEEAVADGSARADLTSDDLFFLTWSTGAIIRAAPQNAAPMIDRHCDRLIDGLRRAAPAAR